MIRYGWIIQFIIVYLSLYVSICLFNPNVVCPNRVAIRALDRFYIYNCCPDRLTLRATESIPKA